MTFFKKYQLVNWFPEWTIGFIRWNPEETGLALIYKWSLHIGFFEIRRRKSYLKLKTGIW